MAEELTNFNPPLPGNQKYEWDKWMCPGKTWRLVEGVDYHCKTAYMRQRIGTKAKDYGLKARSYVEEIPYEDGCCVDSIVFTLEKANFSRVSRSWAEEEPTTTINGHGLKGLMSK